jgi:hypothetical protein
MEFSFLGLRSLLVLSHGSSWDQMGALLSLVYIMVTGASQLSVFQGDFLSLV